MFGKMKFFRRRPDQAGPGPILFRRIAVIGVGLVGGSLAQAVRKQRLAREVVGYSQRASSLDWAVKNGVIDVAVHDLRKAVQDADLVVLATPVSVITSILGTIGPHLRRGCVVTDVGSTKANIVQAAQEQLPSSVFFVGSHPLAGSEKRGVENSRPDLFQKTLCLMTPTSRTHKMAIDRVRKLWQRLGAEVKFVAPEEHDRALTYSSHLPHVIAYGLIRSIPQDYLAYGAEGLRDTTRIAASPASLWNDICLANSKNLIGAIDEVAKNLGEIRRALARADQKVLTQIFKEAQTKREGLR